MGRSLGQRGTGERGNGVAGSHTGSRAPGQGSLMHPERGWERAPKHSRTEPAAAEYAARQQLDPDCFQLSSIGRTATRDFRNGVTVKESGAIALSPSFSE